MDTTMKFSRLPTNVTPVNYDITLTPSFETFTFEGHQSVDLCVSFSLVKLLRDSSYTH